MEEKNNENHNQENGNKTENGDETDNIAQDRVCSPAKELQKDKSRMKGRFFFISRKANVAFWFWYLNFDHILHIKTSISYRG